MITGIFKKISLKSIVLVMLLINLSVSGQLQHSYWSEMISPGKYAVYIKPTRTMSDVKIAVKYYSNDKIISQVTFPFTNNSLKYLNPGYIYQRYYTCDNLINKVVVKPFGPSAGGGDKADGITDNWVYNEGIKNGTIINIPDNSPNPAYIALKSGRVYKLRNMDTKYLLHGDNLASGGNVRQYQDIGILCQEWLLTKNADGTYSLRNKDTNYMLHGDNMASGGNVRQYQAVGIPCQKWWISPNADGTYSLKNADTNNMLHGDNIASGGNVRQYKQVGILCQEWKFTEVAQQ